MLTAGKAELEAGTAIQASGMLNWYNGEIGIVFQDLLKCTPPPAIPSDLKHKKVSMRIARGKKKAIEEMSSLDILEEVEDDLAEEGHSDSEDEIEGEFIPYEDLKKDIFN
jgi:hypothetical protein